MVDMSDWVTYVNEQTIEICSCGHPIGEHGTPRCRVDRSNCNCIKFHSLFVVRDAESFYRPHTSTGVGHALIQGLVNCGAPLEWIELSERDLGKQPECYRCGRCTHALMPILMDRHSSRAVTEVSKGRMTRLWCNKCCDREGIEFFPEVAIIINSALERRQTRGGLIP